MPDPDPCRRPTHGARRVWGTTLPGTAALVLLALHVVLGVGLAVGRLATPGTARTARLVTAAPALTLALLATTLLIPAAVVWHLRIERREAVARARRLRGA